MTRYLVNGVHMEVRIGGAGTPLLLLHGFTGRGSSWAPHLRTFRRAHRTIAPDLLGHGRSDAPADPDRYAVERQAEDLATLLRDLGATPAAVCGYSMGARIALRLAIDHPESVACLVLESPSAGLPDPAERAARRESDERLALTIEREGLAAFVDAWEAQPLFAPHAGLGPAARARLRHERLSHRAAGLANSLRGAGQGAMPPVAGDLGGIRAPALVIAGALDSVGRQRAGTVAAGIAGARLDIVPGAGHTPHLEEPAAFRGLVTRFLADALVARDPAPVPHPPPARMPMPTGLHTA